MASLIDHVGQALTASAAPPSLSLSPQSNIELLVWATGSGRAAARALGVAESTLRGWRRGVKPRKDPRVLVAAARGAMAAPRWNEIYRGDKTLVIEGWIRVSSDLRKRTVYPGRTIPRRVMQSVLRAWAQADDERAERLLYNAIDTHYQPLEFDVILGVWFE